MEELIGLRVQCVVNGCDRNSRVLKMCDMHYRRWRKHGDPEKGGRRSLQDRFDDNYIPVTESGCWIWTGPTSVGYGQICVNGRQQSAHRTSYEIHIGAIPKGIYVLHRCDVKACVNPGHLFLGTQQDNIDDMKAKGRGLKGEKCHLAKLTDEDVINIRSSDESNSILARQYNMSHVSIWEARTRRTWKHI